jgi:hypothetical protein
MAVLGPEEALCMEAFECDNEGNTFINAGDPARAIASYERSLEIGEETPAAQQQRIHLKIAIAQEHIFELSAAPEALVAALEHRSEAARLADPSEVAPLRVDVAQLAARGVTALAAPGRVRGDWDRGWQVLTALPELLGVSPASLPNEIRDRVGRGARARARVGRGG